VYTIQANPLPKWSRLPDRDFVFEPEIGEINVVLFIKFNLKKMADNVTEITPTTATYYALPWFAGAEKSKSSEGSNQLSLEVLGPGIDWIKSEFRQSWVESLKKVERAKPGSREKLEACVVLADLQRDLACYLFFVGQNPEARKELGPGIREAIFGEGKYSLANCLGEDGRGRVEGSLAGAISNLTFFDLISRASPNLAARPDFSTMIVGGKEDAELKIDVVLDFGTRKNGKRVLRIIQLKTDRAGQVIVEKVDPNSLKTSYSGGSVSRRDAGIMVRGARETYPDCELEFFVVTVPSFDSPAVYNIFGRINQQNLSLVGVFREEALRTGLLPSIKNKNG